MFGLLADTGVGSIPWSPLAGGRVACPWGQGTTQRGKTTPATDYASRPLFLDTDEAIVDAAQHIANERGVSMAQVARAWVLKNPVVSAPLVGATKAHHLTDAASALDLTLTDDEITALEQPYARVCPPSSDRLLLIAGSGVAKERRNEPGFCRHPADGCTSNVWNFATTAWPSRAGERPHIGMLGRSRQRRGRVGGSLVRRKYCSV